VPVLKGASCVDLGTQDTSYKGVVGTEQSIVREKLCEWVTGMKWGIKGKNSRGSRSESKESTVKLRKFKHRTNNY
jgi:CelD/BcsL family acetyltransferase involved in cellulose biosynthesis